MPPYFSGGSEGLNGETMCHEYPQPTGGLELESSHCRSCCADIGPAAAVLCPVVPSPSPLPGCLLWGNHRGQCCSLTPHFSPFPVKPGINTMTSPHHPLPGPSAGAFLSWPTFHRFCPLHSLLLVGQVPAGPRGSWACAHEHLRGLWKVDLE